MLPTCEELKICANFLPLAIVQSILNLRRVRTRTPSHSYSVAFLRPHNSFGLVAPLLAHSPPNDKSSYLQQVNQSNYEKDLNLIYAVSGKNNGTLTTQPHHVNNNLNQPSYSSSSQRAFSSQNIYPRELKSRIWVRRDQKEIKKSVSLWPHLLFAHFFWLLWTCHCYK